MKTEANAAIGNFSMAKQINSVGGITEYEHIIGLTKREYFAGLAMASYYGGEYIGQSGMPFEMIAANCVQMADALIEALNKEK